VNIATKCAAIVAGLILVVVFFRSIIALTLLNRHRYDPIADLAARMTRSLFGIFVSRKRDQKRMEELLLWFWPLAMLSVIGIWFCVVLIAFAAFYWATGSTPTCWKALIASGSALSTLGFQTPGNPIGQILTIVQGAIGLFIVVYMLTFLPGHLAAMQRRADKVAWLYARAGSPPTGVAMLAWIFNIHRRDAFEAIWQEWEQWFVELGRTHSISPILIRTRSFRAGEYWVLASGAVLDAAALVNSAMPDRDQSSANICLRAGIAALKDIAAAFGSHKEAKSCEPILVDRAAFDSGCDSLVRLGVTLSPDRDQAWKEFAKLRVGYEYLLVALAERTVVEVRPWQTCNRLASA
jgi:hypothetical protein